MTSTTAPIATKVMYGCAMRNAIAHVGDSPCSTPGWARMCGTPAAAITTNQSSITGPNRLPTLPVPNFCTANRTTRITAAIGTMRCSTLGAAVCRPSTAESTDTAGVITESP